MCQTINSARYAQRIIQTESHESPSFLRKVHRLDPPQLMLHILNHIAYALHNINDRNINLHSLGLLSLRLIRGAERMGDIIG